MSIKTVVITSLSIGILLTVFVLAYNFFTPVDVAQPLVLSMVELRNSAGDPVRKAKLVAGIDGLIADSSETIQDQWGYMVECLPTGCVDDEYFNMILVVVQEEQEKLPQANTITNIIIAHRLWGGESVVEFSKALSEASDAVDLAKSKQVRNKWNEIVECNGECAQMNDLFFEIISLLLT